MRAVAVGVGVAGDLDLDLRIVLEHLGRVVEGRLRRRLDRRLVGVEEDALDHAGEPLDLLGHLVGAAVLVLIIVLGLRDVRALIGGVGDAVAVAVRGRAAVGRDAGHVDAGVLAVAEAVAVGVGILLLDRAAVGRDAGHLRAGVDAILEAVAVGVGIDGLLAVEHDRQPEQDLEVIGATAGGADLGGDIVAHVEAQGDQVIDVELDAAAEVQRGVDVLAEPGGSEQAEADQGERRDAIRQLEDAVTAEHADHRAGAVGRLRRRDSTLELEAHE